jgi:hypothetical protein
MPTPGENAPSALYCGFIQEESGSQTSKKVPLTLRWNQECRDR